VKVSFVESPGQGLGYDLKRCFGNTTGDGQKSQKKQKQKQKILLDYVGLRDQLGCFHCLRLRTPINWRIIALGDYVGW
jgi:hypothetical protein